MTICTSDGGSVTLIDAMGNDKYIVNAARQSVGKSWDESEMDESDIRLLRRLYRDKHTSPFEMVEFLFSVTAPLYVIHQWQRHRTWSYNEESLRYHQSDCQFSERYAFHEQDKKNKQCSGGSLGMDAQLEAHRLRADALEGARAAYVGLLALGVSREEARDVLPVATMKTMVCKVNLHNLVHFLRLRLAPDAQPDIQEYAEAVMRLAYDVAPHTMDLLVEELHLGQEEE